MLSSTKSRIIVLVVLIGAAALIWGNFGSNQEDRQTVRLGYVEWATEVASTNVVKVALEDQLDVAVEIIPVDAAVMWQGVASGDFDAIVAAWLPGTHKDYYEKTKDKVDYLGPNLEPAKIGLVVPSYVEIDSIAELNSIRDKIDGQIIGIDPGAGVTQAARQAIADYGLDLKLVESSGAAMTATLASAIRNEEWVVVTGWSPHWKFQKWDLKYLADPKGSFGEAEYIATIARNGLREDLPEVYKFLDNFKWDVSDMESVMVDIEDGMDPEDAARKWVDNNKDKVRSWAR